MGQVQILKDIIEDFDRNYMLMEYETGRSLSPQLKRAALMQVIVYWYAMRSIAEKVSETEVRLVLPLQSSPQRRKFNLEGVVDLIRTDAGIFMHDIKSLDKEVIRGQMEGYSEQLGIYAHIWQSLNNQKIDGASVISTAIPTEISERLIGVDIHDEAAVMAILKNWDPTINVNIEQPEIAEIMKKFGDVVDKISSKEFSPANVIKLNKKPEGQNRDFGSLVCRKCDGRFSCESYRDFMKQKDGKLASLINLIHGEDGEEDEFIEAATAVND